MGNARHDDGAGRAATVYLTGSTNQLAEDLAEATWGELGILLQPNNSYHLKVNRFAWWAADNGCFSSKGFDEATWWSWLVGLVDSMTDLEFYRHEVHGDGDPVDARELCLFAVAPDVVGDAAATLERSRPWLSRIRELGLPAAFVAQDGSEDLDAELLPWGEFDVLFLGGSTEWKLDPERAGRVTAEARRRGVPVHMGRVNSAKRMRVASSWGCDSADGTFLAFGPKANLPRLAGWLDELPHYQVRRRSGNARRTVEWFLEEAAWAPQDLQEVAA